MDATTKQYDSSVECGWQFGIPDLKEALRVLARRIKGLANGLGGFRWPSRRIYVVSGGPLDIWHECVAPKQRRCTSDERHQVCCLRLFS